jgi:hypothetical protein
MIELAQQECKRTPYTTKSGLRIGSYYEPPSKNNMSYEDVCWQSALISKKSPPPTIEVLLYAAVCIFLVTIFVLDFFIWRP